MASLLYRLGRWCAHHAWLTLGAWAAILAIAAGSAAAFSKPLTNEFSIPGSRFEVVLNDLNDAIPSVAGGSGTVVFRADAEFSDAQRAAIDDTIQEWQALDGVADVTNPFETQEQLDGSTEEFAQAQTELDEGSAQAEAGRAEIEAGQEELDASQTELDEGQAQLDAGVAAGAVSEEEAAAAQAEIDAGQAQIDESQAELDAGLAELEASEEQLAVGQAQIDVGERLTALTDGLRFVSDDGDTAVSQVTFDAAAGSLDTEVTEELQEIGDTTTDVRVDYSAEIVQDLNSIIGVGEAVGVVLAAVVLLIMLGSLVAAGLPIVMALIGVATGIGIALATTAFIEMNSTAPVLALMLGLAVGIDYSLFLLNRHRTQLREGMSVKNSIALATGTSGNAVSFAGMTVIIALAALFVTGIPFLTIMGFVAAGTVFFAVLIALTLTPAAMSLLGNKVLPRKWRGVVEGAGGAVDSSASKGSASEGAAENSEAPHQAKHHSETDTGWAAGVIKRPIMALVGVLAVVALLAFPAAELRLGLPDGSSEPAGSTAYETYDAIRDNFGAGVNGPLLAVADMDTPIAESDLAMQEAQADIGESLVAIDGVEYVAPIGISEDRETLAFQVVPQDGPSDEGTVQLVSDLDAATPDINEATGSTIGFTGQTVANIDISNSLGDSLPVYLSVVIGLSLILLLLVFRSIVIPLLATGGFLLSVAAAFGSVVAVYQLGFLSGIFDVNEAGPILSFLPTLLIGVLFGLAMDYQLFLVSAMREMRVHGASARDAIVGGFNHSARVVVAAAIIMASVFGGFIFAELTMIRPVGLGLGIGVLVDAFLVRMTLTPAVMALLGDKAWYLPKWLDRILPDVDVEGAKLERHIPE